MGQFDHLYVIAARSSWVVPIGGIDLTQLLVCNCALQTLLLPYIGSMKKRDQCRPRSATTGSVSRMLAVTILFSSLMACGGTQIPKAHIASPAQSLFNGQVRADINCFHCHDGDGSGTLWGPNLAKRVPKLTDDGIAQAIVEGPGLMPSFRGKLSDAEVKETKP